MSFREKSAWAMSLILLVAGANYFRAVVSVTTELGHTAPPLIGLVIGYVVMIVIASIVIMSVLAASAGREADSPADEREKIILDKAGHWSGYVLAAGVFGGMMNFGIHNDGNLLFHICFASMMASQIAEYAFQIILYRRGV